MPRINHCAKISDADTFVIHIKTPTSVAVFQNFTGLALSMAWPCTEFCKCQTVIKDATFLQGQFFL